MYIIHVYICLYISTYHICIYVYVRFRGVFSEHISEYMHNCMCVCVCVCVCVCIYVCMYMYIIYSFVILFLVSPGVVAAQTVAARQSFPVVEGAESWKSPYYVNKKPWDN